MSRVVILGAGVAGHTAALHAKRILGKKHEVIVVSPNSKWNWIPSNIWVGVGRMSQRQVVFPLAPVYKRKHIEFQQAKATAIYPDGFDGSKRGMVEIEYTSADKKGKTAKIEYDYLVNATGPQLRFDLTPGLGPDGGHSLSVCTYSHAHEASEKLKGIIAELKAGAKKTLVVGMGHGVCTCEGAAFEYVFNVETELRNAGVRKNATVVYLTNEKELGDFGVGGITFKTKKGLVTSEQWMGGLFHERDIKVIDSAHVTKVAPGKVHYEQIDGTVGTQEFDFAMLLPPFRGANLKAFDAKGKEITEKLFMPNNFMKVDANYEVKPFAQWSAEDWPVTYQSPEYSNIFAAGIAFAPPHAISEPHQTPSGAPVAPAPPRTGMPSGVQGRAVAETIAERVLTNNPDAPAKEASMGEMGAACIASVGVGMMKGEAASIVMSPIVPNFANFPETGRDLGVTTGELGLAGHWIKRLLHTMFIYKAKAYPGWALIPE